MLILVLRQSNTQPKPNIHHGDTAWRATTKTQDLRPRGTEDAEDWRDEKQLQHRGAGEEEPEDVGSGMENLRKKTKKFEIKYYGENVTCD